MGPRTWTRQSELSVRIPGTDMPVGDVIHGSVLVPCSSDMATSPGISFQLALPGSQDILIFTSASAMEQVVDEYDRGTPTFPCLCKSMLVS